MQVKIPVVWEMYGVVYIEANSIAEAIDRFNETCDYIHLPEGSYVDGSFQISCCDDEYIKMFNPHMLGEEGNKDV